MSRDTSPIQSLRQEVTLWESTRHRLGAIGSQIDLLGTATEALVEVCTTLQAQVIVGSASGSMPVLPQPSSSVVSERVAEEMSEDEIFEELEAARVKYGGDEFWWERE